ncbi:M35 family metallopeptidase [Flavitalea sp. BT771]|uniref:M35 family metallopeptidase n=1 Tax=Flavitalea sp. BT771 TaxID=3063329 RepID=UPI0026E1B1B3|nr:M35 family metallopeptidase [Flavitalea sp. BT771]MDO6433099.1 M35 family metallopeptidase [Flavitalea sp. BT771]MDV6221625.1 M35 family metallopeptidase [Flavitalea sp. BT771]
MELITAKVYAHATYKKDEAASLIFELTNHSKEPVHILKWNTPLEGMKTDCLAVQHNGKRIAYDGKLIKRGKPGPEDFISLDPGESASAKIDVGESYDISKPGRVKVAYKAEKMVYFRQPVTESLLLTASTSNISGKNLKVRSKEAAFMIFGGVKPRLTAGEMVRRMELKSDAAQRPQGLMAEGLALLPCTCKGGTPAQQAKVIKAHENGYRIAVKALEGMKKGSFYNTWFGVYTQAHFAHVKKNFRKIEKDFETRHFIYDLSKEGCGKTDYAYTYPRTRTIWICRAFWSAPDTGADSKAGTMVHEHSHASALTEDNAYGEQDCMKLAVKQPGKAIRNADSHEFFARG